MRLCVLLFAALQPLYGQEGYDPTPTRELSDPSRQPVGPPPESPKLKKMHTIELHVEGGGAPTESAYIEIICQNGTTVSGFTDKHGKLAFLVGDVRADQIWDRSGFQEDCSTQVTLPGYRTVPGQPFVVKRLGADEGWAVSITNYTAPEKARKLFISGLQAEGKSKWGEAESRFVRAIQMYPKYASAYLQLGIVRQKTSRFPEARKAYQQAIELDPRFTVPYVQLAELAAAESNWKEVDRVLRIVLPLRPIDVPAAYYYAAAADFKTGKTASAEANARHAVEYDPRGHEPAFRRFLATILASEGKTNEAISYLNQYLAMAPRAPDFLQVSAYMVELQLDPPN